MNPFQFASLLVVGLMAGLYFVAAGIAKMEEGWYVNENYSLWPAIGAWMLAGLCLTIALLYLRLVVT